MITFTARIRFTSVPTQDASASMVGQIVKGIINTLTVSNVADLVPIDGNEWEMFFDYQALNFAEAERTARVVDGAVAQMATLTVTAEKTYRRV